MNTEKIDTHQHIVPPFYRTWLQKNGIDAGGLPVPEWSVEGAISLMDDNDIRKGFLSVSTPGVHLGDNAEARTKAREVNEFSAEIVDRYPSRFGYFATLTLPDVEGAVEEARYAFEKLNADGVVLLTNVRGEYLGDDKFSPLIEELNRQKATVFIHPSELPCPPINGIPPYAADFLLDTTRAAISIARAGWLEKYPEVKFILSHAGGFVPFAAERIAHTVSDDGSNKKGIERLRKFYFDTALSGSPYALSSLLTFADHSRITFGSDWPYATKERSTYFTSLLARYDMDDILREKIYHVNASKLFSR
ncbi:amidohydrolase [Salmonella enterica subsp. enterica]|nr:amidohydrolase [Salmonella enterica subsp. enterica serovar Hvittingfoss]